MLPRQVLTRVAPFVLFFASISMSYGQANPEEPLKPLVPRIDSKSCSLAEDWNDLETGEICVRLNRIIRTLDGSGPAGTVVPLAVSLCKKEVLEQAKAKYDELKCAEQPAGTDIQQQIPLPKRTEQATDSCTAAFVLTQDWKPTSISNECPKVLPESVVQFHQENLAIFIEQLPKTGEGTTYILSLTSLQCQITTKKEVSKCECKPVSDAGGKIKVKESTITMSIRD